MAVSGSNKVACPSCGASVTPGETFCEVCGAALPHSSSAGADTYEAPTMFVPSDAAPQPGPAAPAASGSPVCGVCGYTNQPGDRFCDQCGASLQSAAPAVSADDRTVIGTVSGEAPAAAPQPIGADDRTILGMPAPVIPPPPAPPAGADDRTFIGDVATMAPPPPGEVPTLVPPPPAEEPAPPAAPAAPPAQDDDRTFIGDLSALSQAVAPPPAPVEEAAPAPVEDAAPAPVEEAPAGNPLAGASPAAAEPPAPPVHAEEAAPPVEEAPAGNPLAGASPAAAEPPAPPVHVDPPTPPFGTPMPPVPPVAQAVPAPVAPAAPSAPAAAAAPVQGDRTALEDAIQEHRDNLAMFEQMSQRYQGRALPTHIQVGLDESRASLRQAEDDLAAFDAAQAQSQAAAQPDPAEVARLEDAIQEHRDNLAMFEQMSQRYQGRALPTHIQVGLDESRAALDQAVADLAALQGGAAPVISQPALPAQPVPDDEADTLPVGPQAQAAVTAAAQQAAQQPASPSQPISQPAAPAAPPAPSQPAQPVSQPAIPMPMPLDESAPLPILKARLVLESSGAVIELPVDKETIVVGREDPISGIFPEVDLTAMGGETGGVSRQHARLIREGNDWQLEDLNSTNYTKINGTKLTPSTPKPVQDGDKIHFGRVVMTFRQQ